MENSVTSPRGLKEIRRKAVDLSQFNPVRESLLQPDRPLPLVLEPAVEHVDLAEWVRNNRPYVRQKISSHGGVLFRGFGLKDAKAFQKVAAGVCDELFADYGDLPRENLAEQVYSSTPYPEDKSILYHNESSHLSRWPARINFFCLTVAREGGATPIVDCRMVYRGLDPQVRQAFEEKGLMYVRNFCRGLDVPWQRFFGTEDKSVVEEMCRSAGSTCEWIGNNQLRTRQRCPAVRRHPVTGELTFFNQIQLHHVHCLDPDLLESLLSLFQRDQLPRNVYYGDGSPIEDSVVDHIGEIYEKHAVRFQWQEGDMVSLDNMLTAHARDPYAGERKIVVALGDMLDDASLKRE